MHAKVLTDEQYKALSKKLIDSIEGHYKIIPLNTLKHPRYCLKKPIYIMLDMEGDTIIASLDDIEAFAYADTEFEAINGLCDEIVNIYEDLKDDKEKLGVLPNKWLAYLNEVIETPNEEKRD